MLRKIYSRIIIVSFSIVIVLMLVTGTVLFGVLSNFFVTERGDMLKKEADRINDLTLFYVSSKSPEVERFYYNNLDDTAEKINGIVYILDNFGNLISSDNAQENFTEQFDFKNLNPEIFKGKEFVEIGNMNGMLKGTFLTVGVPIYTEKKSVGVTFISVPVPEINRYKYHVFNVFAITLIFTFVIALIFSYIYSRQVAKPIKQMNKISKEIASGNFTGRVHVEGTSDIDELARNFNYMADSLCNLENMRSSFISNVSHELRTPMTTISGFVEGILDNTISEEDRDRYLKIVLDETRRLARLVTEFLEMSKVDGKTMQPVMKKFDINELIRICIIRFEKQISDKNIDVQVDFECENEYVIADKDSISRVMTNLIDNAIKFNISGGYIKINVFGSKNSRIKIMVENSGIGMSEDELLRVFDRFYKSDKSRSYDKKGVGIGLYLVKNIISAHNETIVAESEKNKWARFTFTLMKA